MKRSLALVAALAALSISSAAAFAEQLDYKPSSQLVQSNLLDFTGELAQTAATIATTTEAAPSATMYASVRYRPMPGYESVRYRPRRGGYREAPPSRRSSGSYNSTGVSQVHAGFLDPEGAPE